MKAVGSVEALIDRWPSLSDFARDAGVTYGAAKQMRRRGSIAIPYWRPLIESQKGQEIGLTSDDLVSLHSASAPSHGAAS